QAVATRRGLPSRLFLRHTCILVSKVRSLRDFQGGSIIGSIVGFVSGSQLLLVCMTAAVGITCLVVAIYLYRQLTASSNIGDDH
ncbi:hypothetical protein, partial [Mycobacteroides abscessus]|uniref:hypothetical protein n=1 Tax=Mycobacteroides abscessus TaxID=36809 RepID=UPI0009A83300